MFSETKDAEFLNYICNHPDVRAGGEIDLDVTPLLVQGIAYSYPNGAIIYAFKEPGVYEAHTQALKEGRGNTLKRFCRWTAEQMFLRDNVEKLVTYAYHTNIPAKKLAEQFGRLVLEDDIASYYELTKGDFYANGSSSRG